MTGVTGPLRQLAEAGIPDPLVRVVDAHAHLGLAGSHPIPWAEAADIVGTMDRLGIGEAWISSLAAIFSSGSVDAGNDQVAAAIGRFPGRFIGFAVVNPNFPERIGPELERFAGNAGMRGIKVHPASYTHNYPITGPNFVPAWEVARRRRMPVLVHSGPSAEVELSGPASIAAVARANPDVRFVIAHAGGVYERWQALEPLVSAMKAQDNLYADLAATGRILGVIEYLVKHLGSDRIIFGSDGPFHCFTADLGSLAFARIADRDKERILGGNARDLLS